MPHPLPCNLDPEEQLLLLLSRAWPSPDARDSVSTLLGNSPSPDYPRLVRLADVNGVSPLLYHNLTKAGGIPEQVLSRLRNAYLVTFDRNARHCRETMRVIGLLRQEGIDAVPLKGSLFSDLVLGDMGLYPTSDLDLLVRPPDLDRAKKIVMGSGYGEVSGIDEEDQREGSYHLSLDNGTYLLELHWNLVMRYFDARPDFWWEETARKEYEGAEITLLSPERYLLYGIFRLFSHGFHPLRFFVLPAGLVNKYQDALDWDKVLCFAGDLGMKRVTVFALRLLHEFLGTDIPGEISGREVSGYRVLRQFVVSGFFGEVRRQRLRMSLFTTLLDTPLDTARVLLRRIFPPLSEVRLRYHLPAGSKKTLAYYLLNPLLLILRKRP